MLNRRSFLKRTAAGAGALALAGPVRAQTTKSGLTITKISHYKNPDYRKPTFNQAWDIVVIETDGGITGIGEGGSKEMTQQCAEMLIGENPFRTEYLWQKMYRGYFYPAGREKLHAMGALDMALWDLKGKAFNMPVYEMLGGLARNYVPCYSTAFPWKGSLKETAKACIESGFLAFRTGGGTGGTEIFDPHQWLDEFYEQCVEIKEGVGEKGQWAIDFHTRFDQADAVTLSSKIEHLDPLFVEDLVRSENPGVYRMLRQQVKVPIAVGEQFGDRWDINELIEQHLIDYSRVTLPNTGGITEFRKIAALCETHYVGLVPHFTGPIATAALVHALAAFPGFVCAERLGAAPEELPYLNDDYVLFQDGKLYPQDRPGLGVEFLHDKAVLVNEIDKPSDYDHPMFHRSDGSLTNW
jgi:galactonate dehydratase